MTLVFPITLILVLLLEAIFHFQLPVLYLVILAIQDNVCTIGQTKSSILL